MKALWKNTVIAESRKTIVIEGNHYFPPDSINRQYFEKSDTHSTCPWKGEAHYYHLISDGAKSKDAAWFYPEPKEAAREIANYVAFWKDVEIVPS